MTFKVGKLIIRGGEFTWRSFRDDERFNTTTHDDNEYDGSRYSKTTSAAGKSMIGSVMRRDLSV